MRSGRADGANAVGTAATFVCGSFVRFTLRISRERGQIVEAKYQTNGCGFMIAAAEIIAEAITGRVVTELHGLDNAWLNSLIETKLGLFMDGRQQCKDTCFEAIQAAFFDYRALQVEEFQGEKALICTCFGVTEETITLIIDKEKALSVEKIAELCNAGSGCGSCRMMIQELIDQREVSAQVSD
jgi:NifU-like protein